MSGIDKFNNTIRKLTKSGRPRKVRKDKGRKRSIKQQVKEMKLKKFKKVQNERKQA